MNKTILSLLIITVAIFVVACAQTGNEVQTQEEDFSQEVPELSEIDQLLAELDELDEQLALDSDLEEIDLELE